MPIQIGDRTGFNVGDRVEYTGVGSSVLRRGDTGTVVRHPWHPNEEMTGWYFIPVRWDREDSGFHECNGACDVGHGWFTCRSDLRLLQNDPFEEDESINSLIQSFRRGAS